jgi:hypothetical protein
MKTTSVSRSLAILSALLAFVLVPHVVRAQNTTYIIFNNETGVPDDQVYVNLTNAGSASGLVGGNNDALTLGDSYSLAQLTGDLNGTVNPNGNLNDVPIFGAVNYNTGAQINITLGQPESGAPPNSVVSGLFEEYINGDSLSNNVDTSYVNGIGMPMSFSVLYQSNSSLVALNPGNPYTNPATTVPGTTIFDALTASTTITPTAVRTFANYTTTSTTGAPTGQITGLSYVAGPQGVAASSYRDWSTNATIGNTSYTALIPYLTNNNISLQIANYTVPSGSSLAGTQFGFVGSSGTSPFNATVDPNGQFLAAQSYSLNATFTNNMNPGNITNPLGANTTLVSAGITNGTAGVIMTGSGGNVGTFSVYIKNSDLNAVYGLYGANPYYTVVWNGNYTTQQNSNNLVDRIVGDFASVINMGMAASTTQIDANAIASNTTANLAGSSLFAGNTTQIGNLTSGQFFYLLSLQQTPSQLASWFGSGIQSNPLFYNNYGSAFINDTDAYTYAYSDRVAGPINADVFYSPQSSGVPVGNLYIELTLSPGAYTYTSSVPEPAAFAMVPFLIGGAVLLRKVRRRRPAG